MNAWLCALQHVDVENMTFSYRAFRKLFFKLHIEKVHLETSHYTYLLLQPMVHYSRIHLIHIRLFSSLLLLCLSLLTNLLCDIYLCLTNSMASSTDRIAIPLILWLWAWTILVSPENAQLNYLYFSFSWLPHTLWN